MILPFPVLIGIAYYLNNNKFFAGTVNKYIVSIIEGLGTYLIVLSLFLEDFVSSPVYRIALFILGFIVLIISNHKINEIEPDVGEQIETIKNILVIFVSTLLLFYVLLSVFRFQPFYLQFLYALIGTLLFNVLAHYLRIMTSDLIDRIDFNLTSFINTRVWAVYIFLLVAFLTIVFVNVPKVSLNRFVNLNNSEPYFAYTNTSNYIVNRYDVEEVFEVVINENIDTGAYMNRDGDYVFIRTNSSLTIYNLQEKKTLYNGEMQANVDGINVPLDNLELKETSYQYQCNDDSSCVEMDYYFYYGDVKFYSGASITRFDDLDYKHTDTGLFRDGTVYLFENQKIDSKVKIKTDKPFLGFNDSPDVITDIDYYEGGLEYLQVRREGSKTNIKMYKIMERDIDLSLPIYSHYRFGILVTIFLIGIIPISDYNSLISKVGHK